MEENEYNQILNYIQNNEYPDDASDNLKRKIRNRVKDFSLKNDNLYYVKENDEKLVITKDKKHSILKLCHVFNGCHLGRNKTVNKISERYYWVGIVKDVSEYVKQCKECQHQNKKTTKSSHEMIPVSVPYKRIWSKIGIDLIGPFMKDDKTPLSSMGYKYVLTIMDYTSKWPEAYPLFSKTGAEVAEKIVDTIYRFGVCNEIVSDCGGEFNNKIMKSLEQKYNIKHITTSPYHPQGNGMVEKFNSTLKSMINKTVDNDSENWHLYLQKTLFAYRTSVHESTKITPFEAMYVRKPVLPNEMMFGETSNSASIEINDGDVRQQVHNLVATKDVNEENIKTNVDKAQTVQKRSYDRRRNVMCKTFSVGDKVLLKNFRRKHGMGTVHQIRYTGPYEIMTYCGKGNYKLCDVKTKKLAGPYNTSSLKPYFEEDPNDQGATATQELDTSEDEVIQPSGKCLSIPSSDDDQNMDPISFFDMPLSVPEPTLDESDEDDEQSNQESLSTPRPKRIRKDVNRNSFEYY